MTCAKSNPSPIGSGQRRTCIDISLSKVPQSTQYNAYYIGKVFLPSLSGTRMGFIKDILAEKKKHLKQNEVNNMLVPNYPEISVKNLYEDAMKDPVVSLYLPSKDQLSGKLPERSFFFGVLCTLKLKYMTDIISEAQKSRYTVPEGERKSEGILITSKWMEELTKYPYFSSNTL